MPLVVKVAELSPTLTGHTCMSTEFNYAALVNVLLDVVKQQSAVIEVLHDSLRMAQNPPTLMVGPRIDPIGNAPPGVPMWTRRET